MLALEALKHLCRALYRFSFSGLHVLFPSAVRSKADRPYTMSSQFDSVFDHLNLAKTNLPHSLRQPEGLEFVVLDRRIVGQCWRCLAILYPTSYHPLSWLSLSFQVVISRGLLFVVRNYNVVCDGRFPFSHSVSHGWWLHGTNVRYRQA